MPLPLLKRKDLILLFSTSSLPDSGTEFDFIEQVRTNEKTKDIPLILLTGKDLDEEETERLNGDIRTIINKGLLEEKDLLEKFKKIIGKM